MKKREPLVEEPQVTESLVAVAEARCALCKAEIAELAWFPFCSQRCKLIDLGKWANESYRVPGAPAEIDLADFERGVPGQSDSKDYPSDEQ